MEQNTDLVSGKPGIFSILACEEALEGLGSGYRIMITILVYLPFYFSRRRRGYLNKHYTRLEQEIHLSGAINIPVTTHVG